MDSQNRQTKTILIMSYLFPPVGGIGVQRALSLAKYLPPCGFEVHVLKANNAGGPVHDPELVRQIPPAVTGHESFTPEIPFSIRQRLFSRLRRGNGNEAGGKAAAKPAGLSCKKLVTWAVQRVLCPEPEILWVPFAVRKARQIIKNHGIDILLVTVPPFSALVAATALKREFP